MKISDYLVTDTIVDIDYSDKEAALDQLARRMCRLLKSQDGEVVDHKVILEDILEREEQSTTFVGSGIAIPQAEADIKKEFAVIVGRSVEGVNYDAARNAKAHVIVLVVCNPNKVTDEQQIEFLAKISTYFKDDVINKLLVNDEINKFSLLKKNSKKETASNEEETEEKKKQKEPIITSSSTIASAVNAKAIMIFADTKNDTEFIKDIKIRKQVIIVTSNKNRFESDNIKFDMIQAPATRSSRMGQVKIGVVLAMSQNLISKDDTVVCVSGKDGSGNFDTIMVLDIGKEFKFFFSEARNLIPADVKPEVLERVLGLASEIGIEGREGKSIGTIFVLGDTNRVNGHVAQLIINPFRGYSESERNIMDPGLVETIKEFSGIDGAFIITGDGVVLSAGSYLRPVSSENNNEESNEQNHIELPSGLGARHNAAAAITAVTNAIAIAVSESTGQVTVFKNGAIALTLSKQAEQ